MATNSPLTTIAGKLLDLFTPGSPTTQAAPAAPAAPTATNPAVNNVVYWKSAYEKAKAAGKPAGSLAYINKQAQPYYEQLDPTTQNTLRGMNTQAATQWYKGQKAANSPAAAAQEQTGGGGIYDNPIVQSLMGSIGGYSDQQIAYAQAQAQQQAAAAAQQNAARTAQQNALRNNYNTQINQYQTSQAADLAAVDRNYQTAKAEVGDQSFLNYLQARQGIANRGVSGSGIESDQNTRLAMANAQALAGLNNNVLNQKDQITAGYRNQIAGVQNNLANLTPLDSSSSTGGASGSDATATAALAIKPDDVQIKAYQQLLETLMPYTNATMKDQMGYDVDKEKNYQDLIKIFGVDRDGNLTLDARRLGLDAQKVQLDAANNSTTQQLRLAELLGQLPDGTATLDARKAAQQNTLDWSKLMGVDPEGNPTFENSKFQNEYALDQWYKQNQIANDTRGLDIRQFSAEQTAAQGWERVRISQQNADTTIARLQLDANKFATATQRNQFKDQTSQVSSLMKSAYTDMNNAMAAMNKYQKDPNSAAYQNAYNRYKQAQAQYDVAYQALDTLSQAGINAGAGISSKNLTKSQQDKVAKDFKATMDAVGGLLGKAKTAASDILTGGGGGGGGKPTQYNDIITSAASQNGVDAALVKGMIEKESSWNPNAGSPAGARGLMQLMPGTASGLGVKNSLDPAQNVAGGTKYIAQQLKKYGDVELALAAYNAGPGAVDSRIKKYGKSWAAIKPHMPKETQGYVSAVLANRNKYK